MTALNEVLDREQGAESPTNLQLGYFAFRVMLGVNLFFHGFMRLLTGLDAWEMETAASFAGTYLPMPLVHASLYVIPFVEIALGLLITLGLFTRWAYLGSLALFFVLMYGQTARQNWSGVHNCMQYGFYYWIMLVLLSQNWLAMDNRRAS